MYYLVQSNIFHDPEHQTVFDVMHELALDYETIELDGSQETIEIKADRKDVFVYGSVKLARLCKSNTHWTPGSFYGGNHTFEIYSQQYKGHLLNEQVELFSFADPVKWEPGESKFIKPYKDAKVFTGRVFTETGWNDFVKESLESPKTPMLNAATLVQASATQKLIKEARLWIVGEQVIGGVYYKFHGDTGFEAEVNREGIEFAKQMIRVFNVADAFVMDIGLTYDGWKIVEVNCINSAGFYHMNMKPVFKALEIFFS